MTRSGSLSPFMSAATSAQPRLQYVSLGGNQETTFDSALEALRMGRANVCTWLRWSTYLARNGDVGGRGHASSLGTEVDVHCALGEDKPKVAIRLGTTQDP